MYVKTEFVDQLLESTGKKVQNRNISRFVDSGFIDGFHLLLDDIKSEHVYQEGEKISDNHLARIKKGVRETIIGMRILMREQLISLDEWMQFLVDDMVDENGGEGFDLRDQEERMKDAIENFNTLSERQKLKLTREYEERGRLTKRERDACDPHSAMLAVNDYLYAMTMKALGSPDIPELFGIETKVGMDNSAFKAEWEEFKSEDYRDTLVEKTFKNQRRKNHSKIVGPIKEKEALIKSRKATPLQMAQYAGEYFALKKRQEGHGERWRSFHKKENAKRMQLLAEMEEVLKEVIGKRGDLNDKEMTPIKISQIYYPLMLQETYKTNIADRNQMSPEILGDKVIEVEWDKKHEVEFDGELREQMKFDKDLFVEIDDRSNIKGQIRFSDEEKEIDLSALTESKEDIEKHFSVLK